MYEFTFLDFQLIFLNSRRNIKVLLIVALWVSLSSKFPKYNQSNMDNFLTNLMPEDITR